MITRRLSIALVVCGCSAIAWMASAGAQAPDSPPAAQPATQPALPQPPEAPVGGGVNDKRDRIAEITAGVIQQKHGVAQWRTHSGLQADVAVTIDNQALAGVLTLAINGPGIRLQITDGPTIGADGKKVWVSPATASMSIEQAQRLLHTFKLFAAAPMLLRDPPNKQVFYRSMHFMGQPTDTFKLGLSETLPGATLKGGEWCMAYSNERSHKLDAVAHIALPLPAARPEDTPSHASNVVVFTEMQTVDNVILPAKWSFYWWTEAAGAKGQPIGSGAASNVQFVRIGSALFQMPDDGRSTDAAPATQPHGSAQP